MKFHFISNKIFISIFILYISSIHFYINSLAILPFNFLNKKGNISYDLSKPEDYLKYYLDGSIYTTLKINNKPLQFHITLNRYTTYISEKTLLEIDPKSAEIQKNEDLYSLEYIGIYRAKYANSSFSFLSNKIENISLNNFSFFMVRELTNDFDSTKISNFYAMEDEEIGFNVAKGNRASKVIVEEEDIDPYDQDYDEEDQTGEKYVLKNNGYLIEENTNIINQLEKQNYISNYSFMIKFDNQNNYNGKIIIGGKPHEYEPKHYSEKYFLELKSSQGDGYGKWGFVLDDIEFNGVKYGTNKYIDIFPDFGFIEAPEKIKNDLDILFFNENAEYCNETEYNKYIMKYCEEIAIKKFKKVSFILSKKYNSFNQSYILDFDYKDLFIKSPGKSNYYYFQIVFKKENYNGWKFGLPIFKKYPAVFNPETKQFGFYKETGEYKIDDNDAKGKKSKLSAAWVLVIILSIIIICLGIAFFYLLPKIRRKKKANELEDDYDYSTQDIIENKIN